MQPVRHRAVHTVGKTLERVALGAFNRACGVIGILAGVDRLALVLSFPGIGQTVEIGIDRAGVQTAAGNRPELAVVGGAAVNESRALGAILDTVAVGIDAPRIGREELVEPLRIGLVTPDRR